MRLLIAGAGIGGLSAALALAQAGVETTLLEQAELFEEAGAGLQISPNASRILRQLGVLHLLQGALEPQQLVIRRARDGKQTVALPMGAQALQRWGAPHLVVHRADLQRALLEAVALAGPRITVLANAALTDFNDDASGVGAAYRCNGREISGWFDGLIGADGLNSLVRGRFEPAGPPQYSNRTAWRALVEADQAPRFATQAATNLWLGRDAHLVHYPLRGGDLVNVVAIVGDSWRTPGRGDFWSQEGDKTALMRRFSAWDHKAQDLLAAARRYRRWPLFDRPPLRHFSQGRIALLGDAAHPMLPFLAQGSAQAIEDAAALGAAFVRGGEAEQALLAYGAARAGRTARVQRQSRLQGHIYHLSGAAAFARDLALASLGPDRLAARYDWLYGFPAPL